MFGDSPNLGPPRGQQMVITMAGNGEERMHHNEDVSEYHKNYIWRFFGTVMTVFFGTEYSNVVWAKYETHSVLEWQNKWPMMAI